ncbi:hypothetical protein [Ovoidimarina sediminis]|uniref:hypothetical protein n=1 Tax=Ovoidimarina sediminis TaxID=3079856 RepID=UPI0029138DCF|nr:hypothetical protein [Rhodophyticola sp. MJ-SS7]MDU8942470.1 hypothetical protein [Rhodophyticola sp. MJ-SS7]
MSHLLQNFQIVLVYENAQVFDRQFADLSKIGGRLKTALAEFGPWETLNGFNSTSSLGIASDSRNITLQRHDVKMALNGFADVLANPLIVNGKRALAKAIVEHQRAILIEVGTGKVPGFAQASAEAGILETLGDTGSAAIGLSDTQADHENRLLLAQAAAVAMIRELAPSAVHWVQSQQVFDAAGFANVAGEGFSLPLYCGPFLYGGEQLPDGSVKAGVRALGSQHLIGKMVVFAPHVQAWSQSYMQILGFVAYCRSIGRILENGETMALEEADATVVRVTHKNDVPQLPTGMWS